MRCMHYETQDETIAILVITKITALRFIISNVKFRVKFYYEDYLKFGSVFCAHGTRTVPPTKTRRRITGHTAHLLLPFKLPNRKNSHHHQDSSKFDTSVVNCRSSKHELSVTRVSTILFIQKPQNQMISECTLRPQRVYEDSAQKLSWKHHPAWLWAVPQLRWKPKCDV